ncbi:CotH kinase family protein [Candidatus Saccharibacteria bacterium]|nr:CotH kinase family protein [Candidatus Saccharibacteria bacterium]
MNNKGRWVVVWVGLFLMILTAGGFLIKGIIDNALYNRFPNRGVPRINIDLNGVSLEEIKSGSKETKYEGNDLQVYDGGEILEYGGVEIKGRGNGTWVQEKKPFQIKFENKVDMFGMGEAKKWYLLANALDETHLRNDIAFKLGKMLDMEYVLGGTFVELYFGGEYNGLYYLTQAVEIGKDTVNLKDELGILVELDNYYGVGEEYHKTGNGDLIVIRDLVSKDKKDLALADFLTDYNDFEVAVKEGDFKKIAELVDVDSFVKYYLVSEFSVNPDAYWTSFYMYKDGKDDKIHAGPIWDFDLAFANRRWVSWMGEIFYSFTETMIRKNELRGKEFYEGMNDLDDYDESLKLSHIVFDLMEQEGFKDEVMRIYKESMHGRKKELISYIYQRAESLESVISFDNSGLVSEAFNELVKDLTYWVGKRYDYFEQVYGVDEENIVRFL